MKKLIFGLLLSFEAFAQAPALTSEFQSLVNAYKLGAVNEQAYCYENQDGVQGYQVDRLQRIASVSKVLTTFLASETMDLNQRFLTRIYIGKDSLHIEGNRDPYFEEDKLLLLFQALNNLGYTSFKQVSFNRDFLFYDLGLESYAKITPGITKTRLSYYLNPKNVAQVRSTWKVVRNAALEDGIEYDSPTPLVSAKKVIISDVNPLANENPVLYLHHSKPFHALLKSMNVVSKNVVAENVYSMASQLKSFPTLMKEFNVSESTFKMYSGSGLPVMLTKTRLDNLASCRTVLKVISLLSESIKKHNLVLSDIMAVNGGKDLGSFRNRFGDQPETHEAVISKTGTLKHTSSLAGVIMISDEIPFAILNHTTSVSAARSLQDRFVGRMFDHLGVATPLDYEKIAIFPWDNSDFLELAY